MIEILEPAPFETFVDLRRDYLACLSAPFDGMWQAFATMSCHHELRAKGERAGYFCVNDEGHLLQFHVSPTFESLAEELFAAVIARREVGGTMVSTADCLFLGLCLDLHCKVEVHTYLYQDRQGSETTVFDDASLTFEPVQPEELESITELQRRSLDQDLGDWLIGYLENLITRRELFALCSGGQILGTGEARVSESQPPFVDLGVITAPGHRGKGVAHQILSRLKGLCYDRNLIPICSTTVGNLAARKAIAKAGFVARYRILQVTF